MEVTIVKEPKIKLSSLPTMVDAALIIERLRVASEIRLSHLARQGKHDPETDELYCRVKDLEDFVDGRIAELIESHPAYPWFSRVKGIGNENIAKVVGLIDITRDNTPSSLWKFAGFSVENGAAPKRRKGDRLSYNSQLRSLFWRLGSSLLRAKGKYYSYPEKGVGYLQFKDKYYQRYQNQGVRIVAATSLPRREGKRYEPEGVISEGHIHNMALRKMIKLFIVHLWVVWREAEGLPVRPPYVQEKLGHSTIISPWGMVDR